LLKVNCASIAETLLESELFGHEPGAFTGASRTHRGRFERADGGTLFLDELGNMSMGLQEKLLRLVEYGEFERLGGQTTLQVDVRVIAATNADLKALASQGKFRADLLDRLSFDVVHLPPLRHRLSDVPDLAHHFAVQMCGELGWELFPGFTDDAARTLLQHPWPGNVRELKNVVERSIARWTDPDTQVAEVVLDPFESPYPDWADPAPPGTPDRSDPTRDAGPPSAGHLRPHPGRRTAPTPPGTPDRPQPGTGTPDRSDPTPFTEAVAKYEKNLVKTALEQQHNHQGRTAEALGLSYDQLRGLLRKHQLTGRRSPTG
jgi:psp operon transcriptional activator